MTHYTHPEDGVDETQVTTVTFTSGGHSFSMDVTEWGDVTFTLVQDGQMLGGIVLDPHDADKVRAVLA